MVGSKQHAEFTSLLFLKTLKTLCCLGVVRCLFPVLTIWSRMNFSSFQLASLPLIVPRIGLPFCFVAYIRCFCNSSVAIFRLPFLFFLTLQCLQCLLQLGICSAFSDPFVQTVKSSRKLLLIFACLVFVPTLLP